MAKGKKKRRERAILRVKMKKVLWTKLNETVRKEEEEEKERKKERKTREEKREKNETKESWRGKRRGKRGLLRLAVHGERGVGINELSWKDGKGATSARRRVRSRLASEAEEEDKRRNESRNNNARELRARCPVHD